MNIGGLVHAYFDNAGPGGVFVLLIVGVACTTYYLLARWFVAGGKTESQAVPSTDDEQPVSMDA